jgi:hypothetical protein
MSGVNILEEWTAAAATALGLDPAAIDRDLLLDLTRDVAHGVARPAAPLTAFLVGIAAGRDAAGAGVGAAGVGAAGVGGDAAGVGAAGVGGGAAGVGAAGVGDDALREAVRAAADRVRAALAEWASTRPTGPADAPG